MTLEDKQLLLKDLCGRLPYGVNGLITVHITMNENSTFNRVIDGKLYDRFANLQDSWYDNIPSIKPYLRPMSSMTEEEFIDLTTITELQYDQLELVEWDNCKTLEFYLSEVPHYCVIKVFDWLNAHHFDYRGLIQMGLALEAPEGMYKIE